MEVGRGTRGTDEVGGATPRASSVPAPSPVPCSPAAPSSSPYAGCVGVLATMHGKEEAVAPVVRRLLGLDLTVPEGFDTDRFGTFTGEAPRAGTMREAAEAKARAAMARTGLPLGLASEGAYGAHPVLPLVQGGVEMLLLVDAERDMVVFERVVVDRPAFGRVEASDIDGVQEFLERVGFPRHGVVVGPAGVESPRPTVAKGVHDPTLLERAMAEACRRSPGGRARVEVDMRALHNPTRMADVGRAAEALAGRLLQRCPACRAPGFGWIARPRGLPCAWCGGPSDLARGELLGCAACHHQEMRPRSDGLTEADPGRCPSCNP